MVRIAQAFAITVWYAVFPPNMAPYCYLFRNRDILPLTTWANGKPVLQMPLARCLVIDHSRDHLVAAVLGFATRR